MKKRKLLVGILAASFVLSACGIKGATTMGSYELAGASADFDGMVMKNSVMAETAMAMPEGEMEISDDITDYEETVDANAIKGNRKLIRNVSIDMETTDFDKTVQNITNKTNALGGYVESSGIRGSSLQSDGSNYANMRIRVPQDKLDEFLETAESSGNVTYKDEDVSDITLKYADTQDHIKTLEIEQERLWALLEKADSIEAIIALEERLSEIRYDLESYQTRLKSYDNQVDYSTVHISISEVRLYSQTAKDSMGTRIVNGFKKNVKFLVTVSEDLIVWVFSHIITLLLLGILGFISYRKLSSFITKKKERKEEKKERKTFFHNEH